MVGEPVAYATGSPELKATGPSNSGFPTPRSPRVRESSFAGAYRGRFPGGEDGLADDRELPWKKLEGRAVEAHKVYVDALVAWERVIHMATCPRCRPDGISSAEHQEQQDLAEAEKERRRIVYRDLCNVLGYFPTRKDVAIPREDETWCPKQRGH